MSLLSFTPKEKEGNDEKRSKWKINKKKLQNSKDQFRKPISFRENQKGPILIIL